jgi:hypothetical protein
MIDAQRFPFTVASTREEALILKRKYAWWYDNEKKSYQQFKEKLDSLLTHVQIMEGKEGFGTSTDKRTPIISCPHNRLR